MSPAAPSLRMYQRNGLAALCEAREAGQNRLLLKLPTGTGKTVMFAELLKWPALAAWLGQFPIGERKMLVIAHREELLDQAAAKILAANPHARIGVEQGDRFASGHSDVVIASIQTLAATKYKRLKRLMSRHMFRLVIVDEAHHAAARTYRTTLAMLGFLPLTDAPADASDAAQEVEAASFDDVDVMERALAGWDAIAPQDRLLVGVTATPNRSDAIGLGCVFQTIAYSYGLKEAIADGFLVPIVPWVIETDTSLDDVRTTAGEFNQKDLGNAVNTAPRNQLAVAAHQEHAAGLATLAFTVDVAHAHALAEEFRRAGIRAMPLSGETPKDDRRAMLRQYTAGQIDVITNCMVLTEGTDLPLTGCILHAKPTKSATLYEQMTGRGLRIFPQKTECIVIDIVDIARRHSLQTAPVLYGLPPSISPQGKDLRTVEDEILAFLEKCPGAKFETMGRLTLAQLRAKAVTFDIWSVPSMGAVGAGLALNWITAGEDVYRIAYPWGDLTETIVVEKDVLGHHEVTVTQRYHRKFGDDSPAPALAGPRKLAHGLPTAREALFAAESFVSAERRQAAGLKDRGAPWRSRPASPKQLAMLGRFKAPIKPGLTAGEASDLIDIGMARRAR